MGLEAATFIHQLNSANPVGASDPKAQGDDHIRMIKAALQATFPAIAGAVNMSHTQLNSDVARLSLSNVFVGASQEIRAAGFANLRLQDTGAALDEKIWDVRTTAGTLSIQTRLDSGGAGSTFLSCTRVATTLTATWAGSHIFSGNVNFGLLPKITKNSPARLLWEVLDGGADAKIWDLRVSSSNIMQLLTRTDVDGAGAIAFTITRAGTVVSTFDVAAAALTHNGNVVPNVTVAATWTGAHIFTNVAGVVISNTSPRYIFNETDGTANNRRWDFRVNADQLAGRLIDDADSTSQNWLLVDRTLNVVDTVAFAATQINLTGLVAASSTISDGAGNVRDIPRRASGSAFAAGQMNAQSANITVNTTDLVAGRTFSIYNDSAAAITLTQGAGVTLRLSGTTTTGSRTIAARGFCTLWANSGTEVIASGDVT